VKLLFFLSSVTAENINDDFNLTVVRKEEPALLSILISPKPDRLTGGLSEEHPFITIISRDIIFEGEGKSSRQTISKKVSQKSFSYRFHQMMIKLVLL
jgi:hypothetical protein